MNVQSIVEAEQFHLYQLNLARALGTGRDYDVRAQTVRRPI